MTSITIILFSATWVGTAQVDMTAWEGGGEHPYRTEFELRYRDGAETPIQDSAGTLIGRGSQEGV